jgi:predicted O-methyltransferase YrrM
MSSRHALDFCPVLADLVRVRTITGRSGRVFEGLGALSTENNLIVLRRLMLELKPERTLEIGLSFGGSCLVFAAAHRDLEHSPMRQHVALDPFQTQVWDDCGLVLVARAGLEGFVDFRSSYSSSELPELLADRAHFGLIYVDGSHLFEDVFIDAFFGTRLLDVGGVIAFDDSPNVHVHKVLEFLRSNCGDSLEEIDLSTYRDDSGKTLRYRVARMMDKVQMTAFRRIGKIDRAWDASFGPF